MDNIQNLVCSARRISFICVEPKALGASIDNGTTRPSPSPPDSSGTAVAFDFESKSFEEGWRFNGVDFAILAGVTCVHQKKNRESFAYSGFNCILFQRRRSWPGKLHAAESKPMDTFVGRVVAAALTAIKGFTPFAGAETGLATLAFAVAVFGFGAGSGGGDQLAGCTG